MDDSARTAATIRIKNIIVVVTEQEGGVRVDLYPYKKALDDAPMESATLRFDDAAKEWLTKRFL